MEKICIVDDYDINLFVLREYLEKKYEVISFDNAIDCIKYLKTDHVKVVLMDCVMPVMDGFEASKIIKNENPNVKILAVTANQFEDNIKKCYESGMDDVISKPVIHEDLLNRVSVYY